MADYERVDQGSWKSYFVRGHSLPLNLVEVDSAGTAVGEEVEEGQPYWAQGATEMSEIQGPNLILWVLVVMVEARAVVEGDLLTEREDFH